MDSELAAFKRIWELSQDSPYMAKMAKPHLAMEGENASCGDWLEISFRFGPNLALKRKKKIAEVRFLHKGCAVSAVAASQLAEFAEGRTLEDLKKLTPEKHLKRFGAAVSPARIKCALLPLEIVQANLRDKK